MDGSRLAAKAWYSMALFDEQGALLDWNPGFAHELALARDLLVPGVALGTLLHRLCEYGGVAFAAAMMGDDVATLRRRLNGPPGAPTAPASFEYEGSGRRVQVDIESTALGRVLRLGREAARAYPAGLPPQNWQRHGLPAASAADRPSDMPAAPGSTARPAQDPACAMLDRETGLASTQRFQDVLEAEWQRALYTQSALAVVLIDLDLFRAYVERHGATAAAAVRDRVAQELGQGIVRNTDLIACYGERSFALLLCGASYAIAAVVAERARAAVLRLDLLHEDSPHGCVTASLGFASTVPAADTGAQQLLQAAETALLQAKLNGRNQTMGGAIGNLRISA